MLWCADYFSTDRLFYSNTTNQWLGAPNAALFGLRNNHGQNNTVRKNQLPKTTTHDRTYGCGVLGGNSADGEGLR